MAVRQQTKSDQVSNILWVFLDNIPSFSMFLLMEFKKKRERLMSGSEENNLGGRRIRQQMSELPCGKCLIGAVMHSAAL